MFQPTEPRTQGFWGFLIGLRVSLVSRGDGWIEVGRLGEVDNGWSWVPRVFLGFEGRGHLCLEYLLSQSQGNEAAMLESACWALVSQGVAR